MEALFQQFEQALKSLDRMESFKIFKLCSKNFTPAQLAEKMIMPALQNIGQDWEKGKAALSQVYMSGKICEELIDTMFSSDTVPVDIKYKMAISVLEDYHLLGKRIVYSILRANGHELLDYGRVTVEELVQNVINDDIETLLISALMLPSALKVKEVRKKLIKAGKQIKIIVGGAPFNFDNTLWEEVGADAMGRNAIEAMEIISAIKSDYPRYTKGQAMTSMERVMTTIQHKEPDRVPLFLLPTLHGAKELGLTIKDYFSKADNVVEGQLRLRKKYQLDCLSNFFYASLETEAWGSEVIYRDDGPPNSGAPIIRSLEDIKTLEPPDVKRSPCLVKALKTAEMMKMEVGDEVPIVGIAISPFSLPVMQMGFDKYIEPTHKLKIPFESYLF